MLTVVPGDGSGHEAGKDSSSLIDEIVREGARRMLAEALQAEVEAYIAAFAAERGEDGRRLVVRNGYREPRTVLTSAGAVEVTAPRINDKRTSPSGPSRSHGAHRWAENTAKGPHQGSTSDRPVRRCADNPSNDPERGTYRRLGARYP